MKLSEKEFARFVAKVDKEGPLPDQSNVHYKGLDRCWVWTGYRDKDGYGTFRLGKNKVGAHRVSWFLRNSYLSNEQCVCHKCDNPGCVNPDHLFEGTHLMNTSDMLLKGRSHTGNVEFLKFGEDHHSSKLNFIKAQEIRIRYAKGEQLRALALDFGVHHTTIHAIILNKTWKPCPTK